MKVLQIASGNFFSTYGGGQVYVKNITDEFLRRNVQLSILACDDSLANSIKEENYQNCKIYTLNPHLCGKSRIKTLLKEIAPDVLHIHAEKALFTQICREMNIACVVTAHHGGILCPAGTLLNQQDSICKVAMCHQNCLPCCLKNIRSGKYWYPIMRWLPQSTYLRWGKSLQHLPFIPFITPIGQAALGIERKAEAWNAIRNNAQLVIAPSTAIATAMERNGLSRNKIQIIPHGIPLPEKGADMAPPPSSSDDELDFFYVGRICRVKGLHVLLKAFDSIGATSAKLHLIGGAGNKEEVRYMKRLQNRYRHNPQIIWHGKMNPDQIYEAIRQYHVLVHPAIYLEVFGLNIAEALAMGKPVLATRCGGAEMQLKEGVNGWLVEPNNVAELKRQIRSIIAGYPFLFPKSFEVNSIGEHCDALLQTYKLINS